jgi:2-oxoglutarate dehydrogenase E1 component
LSGQDSRRGTFSHRHAVLHDAVNGKLYTPLAYLSKDQARFEVWDSPLSEAGVLGFEYGYSLDSPDALTIWEAQFGDFANGAQVLIDQFLSSSEDKWYRLSGLVLLLPHGFEGQGPEHSSARLERWLNLCAEDNMQVCNLTTPAQIFHVLRRQCLRPYRKPLIIMSPKSLLRSPNAVSTLEELAEGSSFQRIIPDQANLDPKRVKRVLLCSGKVYYDLAHYRAENKREDVAILRAEQIYPLRKGEIERLLKPYGDGTQLVWVQEEPWNMGAWYYMQARLPDLVGRRFPLSCVSRPESASPATGSMSAHKLEQERLMERAFAGL